VFVTDTEMILAWEAVRNSLPVHLVVQLILRSPAERFHSRKVVLYYWLSTTVCHVTQPTAVCSRLRSDRGIVSFSVLAQYDCRHSKWNMPRSEKNVMVDKYVSCFVMSGYYGVPVSAVCPYVWGVVTVDTLLSHQS